MKKKKNLIVIFVVFILFIVLGISYALTINNEDPETMRKAIIETGRAYYRKGEYMQYDHYRKKMYAAPEEATCQNTVFSVCSGYTYQVYYNTLNIELPLLTVNLMDYAKKISEQDSDSKNIIYYNANAEELRETLNDAKTGTNDFLDTLTKKLLPGDIVVIRRDDNQGHAMIVEYTDNQNEVHMLESTGSAYDWENHVEKYDGVRGTVREVASLKQRLFSYNANQTAKLVSLAVIRIVTDDLEYPNPNNVKEMLKITGLTDSAKTRLEYPSIDIDKTSTVNGILSDNQVVELGDIIEYTIKIKNNGTKSYSNLTVKENISQYATFIEETSPSQVTFDKSKYTWTIKTVEPEDTVTIKYKVKVNKDIKNLGKKIESTGKTGNIVNANIVYEVGINLDNKEENSLLTAYNKIKDSSSKSELGFIIDIYKEAGLSKMVSKLEQLYDSDTKKYLTASDLVKVSEDKCEKANAYTNKYCKYTIDSRIKDILLNNFYGVRIKSGDTTSKYYPNLIYINVAWNYYSKTNELEERARTLATDNLKVGDIILVYNETEDVMEDKVYMYIGNNTLIRKNKDLSITEYNDSSSLTTTVFFRNLIGDNYVVLRPSLINYIEVEKIELNKKEANIDINEQLELIAKVTPDNVTNEELKWESSNPEIATVKNGIVKGIQSGTTVIKATIEKIDGKKVEGYCTVKVNKPVVKVSGISLDRTNVELKIGEKITLKANITPNDATNKQVVWTSDNSNVAIVDNNGLVTAKNSGVATITVTTNDGNYKASSKIAVREVVNEGQTSKPEVRVESVEIEKTNKEIRVGDTIELKAQIKPETATNKGITWISSDPSVATVSEFGEVNLIKSGKVTITAEVDGKRATIELNVLKEKDVKSLCEPYITYSTKVKTSNPVRAILNFQNKECEAVGNTTKNFIENGEYQFRYQDSKGRKGQITAKVSWIEKEEITEKDETETEETKSIVPYIIIGLISLIIIIIIVIIFKMKKKKETVK